MVVRLVSRMDRCVEGSAMVSIQMLVPILLLRQSVVTLFALAIKHSWLRPAMARELVQLLNPKTAPPTAAMVLSAEEDVPLIQTV